jgi:PleD family two-component response regulator
MEYDKQTILVVDDNRSNINILIDLLKNYDVIPCLDGHTALEIVDKEEIGLILLDIMMPQMVGFEVCTILKANPKNKSIPIIFISAKHEPEQIAKGFELGAVDYISKPFNPLELKCRVKTHLELQYNRKILEQKNIELALLNQKIKDTVKKDMEELMLGNQYLSGEDVDFGDFDAYLDNITLDS